MQTQSFTKPVVTVVPSPRPPAPKWQGIFLEPVYADLDVEPWDDEADEGDN